MKTIAYFCGAGAECGYGLPSGGKFALDMFRQDVNVDKETFRRRRDLINKNSSYAKYWLPDDYLKKMISSFGRSSYDSLIKGSVENRSGKFLDFFNRFDSNVEGIVHSFHCSGIDIRKMIEDKIGEKIGDTNYMHSIKLSPAFSSANKIFSSDWFSALLTLYQCNHIQNSLKKHLNRTIKSLLELVLGASGGDFVRSINESVFEETIETIDIFDDIGGILQIDYKNAGSDALDYIVSYGKIELDASKSEEDIIKDFCASIIEEIISQVLDYQELIDSNWRYLYSPKYNWARFCKMSVFLYTAQRYIRDIAKKCEKNFKNGPGYYHDIKNLDTVYERIAVGTTNYNKFAGDILGKVYYLNGCVEDMYDPYCNAIVKENYTEHFTVPFMFTQSGIKPLTSIDMSRRYVELFDYFKAADYVVVIGFGFNGDDGHINGIFRTLIEEEKDIYILHYTNCELEEWKVKREYQEKLRVTDDGHIHIIQVNGKREEIRTGELWSEYVKKILV